MVGHAANGAPSGTHATHNPGGFRPLCGCPDNTSLTTGNFRAFRFLDSLERTLVGAGLGIALIVFAYVILPGVLAANPARLNWSILLSTKVYGYSTLLGGPLGEEFGWRGYALPKLEVHFGPVIGSVILGALWAGWHLPLFLIPGWTSSPFWVYILIVIGLSLIISFGTNLARFAVLPAILMHAIFNTVSRFLGGLFGDIQPSSHISFELVLALCGLGVASGLTLATRGRLAYQPRYSL